MTEKNVIDAMGQDIRIPDIVQRKADMAFDKIRAESVTTGKENKDKRKMEEMRMGRRKAEEMGTGKNGMERGKGKGVNRKRKDGKAGCQGKRKWKMVWVLAAAAVLIMGTTVCAAYLRWSKGLERQFEATEEEKEFLEEQQIAAPAEGSATVGDVTVSAQQSIVDKEFAHLSFRVEGFDLEEGEEPAFEWISFDIDGHTFSWNGRFYNGLQLGEDGKFYYDDGSEAKETPDGAIVERFADENGNMEFMADLFSDEEVEFIGKTLHVCFTNLGMTKKAGFTPKMEGVWEFDVELKGSDKKKNFTLSEALGDSGATVTHAELSPVSIEVIYQFGAEEIEVEAVDQDGNEYMAKDYAEPPMISGVRLKDGTYLTGIMGAGRFGWVDLEEGIYHAVFSLSRIINTDEVDALLFVKSYPEENVELSEENLYIVPVE